MASTDIEESSGTHTYSLKYTLKHTWIIDNFPLFYIENAESSTPAYPRILSLPFTCSEDERIQFQIELYPKGINKENKDYISLFIEMIFKETANVPIRFKMSLLNDDNKSGLSSEFIHLFTQSDSWGWENAIERRVLLDKTKGLLPDGKLTLIIEVEMYSKPVTKSTGNVSLRNLKLSATTRNSERYGNLLESGHHSDVVLVLDNEKELKAHKAILSAHSPVFRAMFTAEMKEMSEGRVVIEDLSFDVAKGLLKFLYTGNAESCDNLTEELLPAADKYGVEVLKQICGQILCYQVNSKTAARLYALADRHSVAELRATCFEYIRGHLAQVMITEEWPLVDTLIVEELRQLARKEAEGEEYPNKKKKSNTD